MTVPVRELLLISERPPNSDGINDDMICDVVCLFVLVVVFVITERRRKKKDKWV